MYLALAILTGGFVSVMIEANGELQLLAGAVPSLIFIHLSGLSTAGVYGTAALLRRRCVSTESPTRTKNGNSAHPDDRTPWWFLLAGVIGVAIVFMSNEVYRRGGVVLTLMGALAGQTLVAQLLENTRWFSGRRSPLIQRLLSLVLILPGAAIFGFRSGVGALWVALSWLPGGMLMIQSMMNSRNVLRFGQPVMLLSNYVSALSALGILVLFSPHLAGGAFSRVPFIPVRVLCGGGILGVVTVGLSSFLLNRAPALKVVLGMYAGQIAVGILLDALSSRPLALENIVGIVLVIAGLFAGKLPVPRRRTSNQQADN